MKVKELMIANVESCRTDDNLKRAVEIMLKSKCGFAPVVGPDGTLTGVVSEDTVCMAAVSDKKMSAIKIADIELEKAFNCHEDEKIEKALKKMGKKQVNRLIVTSQNGEPVGMISVPNLLSVSGKKKKLQKLVFSVLKAIYKPRPLVLREIEISA